MEKSLAKKLLSFYRNIKPPAGLPGGVHVLYPQQSPAVMRVVEAFLEKFYNDNKARQLVLGINPGRYGAGITGINFTAPRQLSQYCGISGDWADSSELSAEFIYEVIEHYGGVEAFYGDYFISAVSPLGFTKNGVNLNYYDDPKLQTAITPFVVSCLRKQLGLGFCTERCICIGGEKNFKFLKTLNDQYAFFDQIIPLPHPRFILQYRRKQKDAYIRLYLDALRQA